MSALRVVGGRDCAPAKPAESKATRLYGLPNCDTCRKARRWLEREGVEFDFIDYRAQPIPAERLRDWARQLDGFANLINRSSTSWRQLPEARRDPGSDAEWIVLLRDHPALVKRPVLETADGAISLGFREVLFRQRLGLGE